MKNTLLSKRLKELRKIHNYTQDYVADVLGMTRQTYSHYETGRRNPSPETIYKLATLYNVSVDELLHLMIKTENDPDDEKPKAPQYNDSLSSYLEYFNDPYHQKKHQYNTVLEKELLYFFQMISESDQKELIEIAKIKARKKETNKSPR